jgi:tripartite-type tricarboxylate transporter receptor subunit TctC
MAQGAEVTGSTPEEFAAHMRNEIKKWAKLTSTLKLQTD